MRHPGASSRRRASVLRAFGLAVSIALSSLAADRTTAGSADSIILATTTSTRDSGLLDELVPRFEKEGGAEVKVIAVGTGAALRMAARGDADAVLVHAPAAEKPLVASGDLVEGRLVMFNDFVLLGPPDDPAGVGRAASLETAFKAIAARGAFVSRGDDSGTHKMEMALWEQAGIDPASLARREETGQGMGETLRVADQRRSYTLADRGTFLAQRKGAALKVVFEGAPALLNIYHVYLVNPRIHKGVKTAPARAFAAFLTSPAIQDRIAGFKRDLYGEPLFRPAAALHSRQEPAGVN